MTLDENTQQTLAGQQYQAAHAAHYTTKDLRAALELYKAIVAEHGSTIEAGYSRSQMHNIVKVVVSQDDLLSIQVDAALARLAESSSSHASEPSVAGVTSGASAAQRSDG